MRTLRQAVVALGAAALGATASVASAAPSALAEAQVIPLPGVARRIDHLAVDAAGKRLFVAALGNGTLEVLDLAAGKRVTSITGLKEPQGVAYLPHLHRIVVAMRGGEVAAFDESYQRAATLPKLADADNLRFDAAAGRLYVGYGDGALGVIDPLSLALVTSIPLGGHPESFRLADNGAKIYVNVPDTREVLVVDRARRSVVARMPLGRASSNYPMYLDEPGHRLFVGVRQPAELLVFDTASDTQVAAVPCVGDTDDLFYDLKRQRLYVIGGEGYIDVLDAAPSAHYERLARLKTRPGARTGLWSSELDRLFVAWPSRDAQPAEIQVLAP